MCNEVVRDDPYVPDHLGTQEVCNGAVQKIPLLLTLVPNRFQTQEMCLYAVCRESYTLQYVPDHFRTQEMYSKAVDAWPWLLKSIPDHLKTQKMYDKAVMDYLLHLQFIPDWFVKQQQIDVWYDDTYYCNDDTMIEWYNGYQKRKAQKAKIKEELMPIAWHSSRWWDWCVPEDEKRETK